MSTLNPVDTTQILQESQKHISFIKYAELFQMLHLEQ